MATTPPTTASAPLGTTPAGPKQDTMRAVLFMLLAINLLPFMNVAAKFLSDDYHTVQVVWARYAGHLVFVLLMFMPRRGLSLLKATKPGIHIIRSMLMFLATVCFFTALRFIEVPVASAINFISPLIVTALAAPFLGESVGIRRWTAVAVGFAGALIIIRPGGGEAHWAMILVLGTAFCYATYQIYTRKFAAADPPETSITYIAIVGAVISSFALPFYWVTPVSVVDALLFALLGLIGGLGHYFVIRAFQHGEASVLAPFNYGQLVMAIVLSYLVFGTFPDLWTFVGGGIIISSGLYITYRETARKRKDAKLAEG
ncbi:MAG: DMT family transporter [Thalassobaculaceae bacterium]